MPSDTSSDSSAKQRQRSSGRPRPISERRREQNRIAQKTYRDRRKNYLQQLEILAERTTTRLMSPSLHSDESHRTGKASDQSVGIERNLINRDTSNFNELSSPTCRHFSQGEETEIDLSGSLPGLPPFDPLTSMSPIGLQPSLDENFAISRTDLGAGPNGLLPEQPVNAYQEMNSLVEAEFPEIPTNDQQVPTCTVDQAPFVSSQLDSVLGSQDGVSNRFSVEDILVAGIRTLSEEEKQQNNRALSKAVSQSNIKEGQHTPQCPPQVGRGEHQRISDVHVNAIHISTMSFVAACVANAAMLGLSPEALWDPTSQSPFYQMRMADAAQFAHTKPLLRPSTTQLNYPHHPYLDILPFPSFRNRTIQLLQMRPLPFNPTQLCEDLKNDGIICWGSTKGEKQGYGGSGAPWDIRSWEIKPWFLNKWRILFDGPDGEMYQHSRWWCELRGESFSYPW